MKQASVENEVFIYMIAKLLALSAEVPAALKEWLIYY